jgi:hypothetical protein
MGLCSFEISDLSASAWDGCGSVCVTSGVGRKTLPGMGGVSGIVLGAFVRLEYQ